MIIVEPVIETFDARNFTEWPVSLPAGSRHLALCGELAPDDVGTAMAVIASYNRVSVTPSAEGGELPGPARLIRGILLAECLLAPGGFRVRDTTAGLTVNPGCCCGLEDWREWNQIAEGRSPDLGHDPAPWMEHLGPVIRIWPDGGLNGVPPAGASPIEIAVSELPELIGGAHQKLRDFLDLLEPWALPLAGEAAVGLAATLATHFQVS